MSEGIVLQALDGANPLGFLAALGTLRLAHLSDPGAQVRLGWERLEGSWRPRLQGLNLGEQAFCELLIRAPWAPVTEFESLGKNLTVSKEVFAAFVEQAYSTVEPDDRRTADFAAAFGSEVCIDEDKGRIEYTDLCFITGSGHQDFLGTVGALASKVTEAHLRDALFGEWRLEKGLSMRWDPSDISEYALRWDDPGPRGAWAVWGANRLAVEALPFFPTMPVAGGLQTTGFRRRGYKDEFTWPIWGRLAGFDAVRSIVALRELREAAPDREVLRERGIDEVYRAQRDRVGQGANFKVSFRPARAV